MGGRPNADQLGNFLGAGGGPGNRGPASVNDFFNGPGAAAGARPGVGTGTLPANRQVANNRPQRVENRQQLTQNRQARRDDVRNEFRDNHPRYDFAMDHPNWAAWRVNAPYRWATVAALTGWCGYTGAQTYYDYGETVYYQDNAVYQYGQQIATEEQYTQQAEQIATTPPTTKNPDWMPLGVFAMTQDGTATGPKPTIFFQLNVSKEGIIGGSMQNTTAGTYQPIEGMVDTKSQRAAWVTCGTKRPIMEAGIFNLTKDEAPALVHFEDGKTQQVLLIRLDEPKN